MKRYIILAVLLAYFAFTSGAVYEIFKCDATNRIEVPYSIPLSSERTGLGDVFNADDMNCMRWLISNAGDYDLIGDYNTRLLIAGYLQKTQGFTSISDHSYIFVSSWNTRHQSYVEGSGIGLRIIYALPDNLGTVVYQSGDARIYKGIAQE
jgi:hypothetical protein